LLAVVAKYLKLPLRNAAVATPLALDGAATQLPAPLLKSLRAAIAVGDIETLRTALQPLYSADPELVAWVQQLERQLDNFDIDAVRDLLASTGAAQ